MKTCYIIGAAELAIGRLRPSEGDFVIAADAGLLHLAKLHIKPDLMLGDFDSLGYVPSGENVEVCPVRKDDTDTMAALRRAVDMGCERALIFGGSAAAASTTPWQTSSPLPGLTRTGWRLFWWARAAA